MLKCYLGRFSVRRRCVAPHYRLHWATKIRKIREINTFRHYFSPLGPKKCATAKWAQGRNATAMRAGGAGGRATGQQRAGTRAGQDARAGGAHEPAGTRRRAADRTEGGDGRVASRAGRTSRRAHDGGRRTGRMGGWVDGWAGSRFSGRFSSRLSSRLSAQHAARATRAGRRPANRPPRPGAPHPAAGCAGWSGCRTGGTESRSSHCPCAG